MSATQMFDQWYNKLDKDQQEEVLQHVLNKKCNLVCEGFYAGPSGTFMKGLFVAPSGVSQTNLCPVCGQPR